MADSDSRRSTTVLHRMVVGAGFAVTAVALLTAMTSLPNYNAERYGTLAEWVAGLLTAGAVAAALGGVAFELRRHGEAREADAQMSRRAQAERVAVWLESSSTSYIPPPGAPRDIHPSEVSREHWSIQVTVGVMNGSDLPIYDAHVSLGPPFDREERRIGIRTGLTATQSIGPQRRFTVKGTYQPKRSPYESPAPYIDFTDAAGVAWRRMPDGLLEELPNNMFARSGLPPMWDRDGNAIPHPKGRQRADDWTSGED